MSWFRIHTIAKLATFPNAALQVSSSPITEMVHQIKAALRHRLCSPFCFGVSTGWAESSPFKNHQVGKMYLLPIFPHPMLPLPPSPSLAELPFIFWTSNILPAPVTPFSHWKTKPWTKLSVDFFNYFCILYKPRDFSFSERERKPKGWIIADRTPDTWINHNLGLGKVQGYFKKFVGSLH